LGTGYYYFGLEAQKVKQAFKVEIRLDKPNGLLIGTAIVKQNGIAETLLRNAKDKRNVYLKIISDSELTGSTIQQIRFFAGSPKTVSK